MILIHTNLVKILYSSHMFLITKTYIFTIQKIYVTKISVFSYKGWLSYSLIFKFSVIINVIIVLILYKSILRMFHTFLDVS